MKMETGVVRKQKGTASCMALFLPMKMSEQSWALQGGVVHRAVSSGAAPTLVLYDSFAGLQERT